MRSAARRSFTALVGLGLLAAGWPLTLPAQAAVAAGASAEVNLFPADPLTTYSTDQVWVAGATGFLHRYGTANSAILWTRYADGATTEIPSLAGVGVNALTPAGGDLVAAVNPPGHSGEVGVLDLSTKAWRLLPRPASDDAAYLGFFGDAMVVATGPTKLGLRRFAADGTATTTPVTGLPADATGITSTRVGDATAAVLRLTSGDAVRYAVVDLPTAAATVLPAQPSPAGRVLLSADRVGFLDGPVDAKVLRSYSRAGLADDPRVTALPDSVEPSAVGMTGTHVVALVPSTDGTPSPVIDYSAGGTTVLPLAQQGAGLIQGIDGLVLVGGTGPGDWAVRRMTADGRVAKVLPLSSPLTNAGLSISKGLLRHVEAHSLPGAPVRYLMFNHNLVAEADAETALNGGTLVGALPCDATVACTRTLDGNWYGTSYLIAGTTATTSVLKAQRSVYASGNSVTVPSAPGGIVDVSPTYAVVDGTNPAKQYVIDTGHAEMATHRIGAAALWFDTLWTSPKSGYVAAKNLATGKAAAAVGTGAPCVADELQATARYLYWSCGAKGPAGVYDRSRKVSAPVAAGPSLLGDGYLVQHPGSGELVRYDLATGAAATVATIARGTLADDRGISWAVDKFGGDIAYVDAGNSVHVVDPGVAPSVPAAGASYLSAGWLDYGQYGAWSVEHLLTRPVASWTLTITQVSTGKVVSTHTGGPEQVSINTGWDGYLPKKQKVPSGHYRYTTTASAMAGATPATIGSGTLLVEGGLPNLHSYEDSGEPSILGVKKNAEGHWLVATAKAALRDNGYTENWSWGSTSSSVNALVPFGTSTTTATTT